MKNILAWIKANPITFLSGIVGLVALVALVWFVRQTSQFTEEVADQRNSQISELQGLIRQNVTIPPSHAAEDERELSGVTINEASARKLQEVYGRISKQYDRLLETASGINREGHNVLVEDLFPDSGEEARFNARGRYRDAFRRMLEAEGEGANPLNVPRLNAGLPLTEQEMQFAVERVQGQSIGEGGELPTDEQMQQRSGTGQYRPGTMGGPGQRDEDEEAQQMLQRQRQALLGRLRRRARQIDVYVDSTDLRAAYEGRGRSRSSGPPGMGGGGGRSGEGSFPFDVAEWSASSRRPSMAELWEGQLELWMQQDVVEAIRRTNADATSVLDAPVKRLMNIRIVPGYVGLHTVGGVRGIQEQSGSGGGDGLGPTSGLPGAEGEETGPWTGAYGIPSQSRVVSEGSELPNNFHATPTGRVSNYLYDVRHMWVTVVADYQRLPAFFNALSETNFMTVLETNIFSEDEYVAMGEGYMYGQGDAVRVQVLVESLWLRDWTEPLMPEVTKQYLRIESPPEGYQASDSSYGMGSGSSRPSGSDSGSESESDGAGVGGSDDPSAGSDL
jgi:hypothetical protein